MDSDSILACLGKASDSPEVTELFAVLGVRKQPRIPRGDIEARIDLVKEGLSLIFKPEGSKTSKLVFVALQMFSDETEGFRSFKGQLPKGLLFTDTQAEVQMKVGSPTKSSRQSRLDNWENDDIVLMVEYSRRNGRISMISYHLPEYY